MRAFIILVLPLTACDAPQPPHSPVDTGTVFEATGGRVVAWGAGGVYVSNEDGASFTRLQEQAPQGVNAGDGVVVTWSGLDAVAWEPATGAPVAQASFACEDGAWLNDAMLVRGALLGICTNDLVGEILRAEADGSTTHTGIWASSFQPDQGALYLLIDYGREGTEMALSEPADLSTADARWADETRGPVSFRHWGDVGNSSQGSYGWAPWADGGALRTVDLPEGEFVNRLDLLSEGMALVDILTWPEQQSYAQLLDPSGATVGTLESCDTPRIVCRDGQRVETWCSSPLIRRTWERAEDGWDVVDSASFPALDVQHLLVLEIGD